MLSKLMQFKCIVEGGLGAKPPVAGKFLQFLEKHNHFNVIWITFWTFWRPLEKTKLLLLRIYLKFLNLLSPFSPLYLQIKFKPLLNVRSQKFAIGGCFGSLGVEPPKAVGGLGAKSPVAGGWRSGSKAYSRWRSGGGAHSALKFCIFLAKKKLNFRANLIQNNAFKTWHRNKQCKQDQTSCINGLCRRWLR